MRSDYEKQQVLQTMKSMVEQIHDEQDKDSLLAQIWVVSMNITDEDVILDRELAPESEAAAFRAVDWLYGRIEQNALIVI